MAFYSSASNASLWRGVHYYENGKVKSYSVIEENVIQGVVSGSEGNVYDTTINLDHPRKSTCNCPFANGRKVICKHVVALYFTSVPGSYKEFKKDMEEAETLYELQEEQWRKETHQRIENFVAKLSEKEARKRLVDILYEDALGDRYRRDYW